MQRYGDTKHPNSLFPCILITFEQKEPWIIEFKVTATVFTAPQDSFQGPSLFPADHSIAKVQRTYDSMARQPQKNDTTSRKLPFPSDSRARKLRRY